MRLGAASGRKCNFFVPAPYCALQTGGGLGIVEKGARGAGKEENTMFELFNKKEEKAAPAAVTRDTIIGDILDLDETTAPYFFEIGMHCLGCPASRGESIADACAVHGTDCDALIAKINAHIGAKA